MGTSEQVIGSTKQEGCSIFLEDFHSGQGLLF